MGLSREEAANKLGMKPEEIVGIEGNRVTTHDGTVTEIDGDTLTTRTGDGPDGTEGPDADTAVAKATPDGPQVVDGFGDAPQASVVEAMAQAPAGVERADTPPRDPRLDGEVPGAFDDSNGLEDVDDDQADADEVPDASTQDVMDWVNEDPAKSQERARRAREHEQRNEKPRRGLLAKLAEVEKG